MILYINSNKIQLEKSKPIALTKQVNTIASLSTRQNDYVQNIKAPRTSENNRALNFLSSVGSNSQVPYNRNVAKLFSDTGDAIINNGFAVVKKTDENYNITIYEGIISFWKKIENITLKDVGLPDLNHLRNVTTIIDSLENDLSYRYLIADYNGKFLSNGGELNADYLIPSALVSYIFQRVFHYAGYTYTGTIFSSDDFTDTYLTYPKSIGSTNQQTTLLHSENYTNQTVDPFFPDPGGFGYINFWYNYLFQDSIPANPNIQSFGVYNEIINILTSGLYQFKLSGTIAFPEDDSSYGIFYWVNDPANPVPILNNIDRTTQIDITIDITLNVGDQVFFGFSSSVFVFGGVELQGISDLDTSISLVEGDSIDFEEAFIDFKCTDFMKEIMWQFSLTPFASRFTNEILFLTEDEKYSTNDVIDWSDKFVDRIDTEYQLPYAQTNDFKYKYNRENENHNDGKILINDVNLPEEKTVIQSSTYSPERFTTFLGANELLQVRMWEKDIQDDGSIEYKDLIKRFHFLRQEDISGTITIESNVFANSGSTTEAKKAIFSGLSYDSIIAKYYNSTRTVLNNTKIEQIVLKLNSNEATGLDQTKRYHFKQLGGDYIIDKMTNYVNNQPTRFNLIKINAKELINQPPEFVPLFIEITNTNISTCTLTLDVNTNIVQPVDLQIRAVNTLTNTSFPFTPIVNEYFDVTMNGDQVVFDLNNIEQQILFTNYYFSLKYLTTVSNQTLPIDIGSCGTAPTPPPTQTITIDRFETVSIISNIRKVRLYFTTDFNTPTDFDLTVTPGIPAPVGSPVVTSVNASNTVDVDVEHSFTGGAFPGLRYSWVIGLSKDGIVSNNIISTT